MEGFYKLLQPDTTFQHLKDALEQGKSPQLLVGLSTVQKAHMVYSLTSQLQRSALVLVPDEATATKLCADLNHMLGFQGALLFPMRDLVFQDMEGLSHEYEYTRLGILGHILAGNAPIVVTTPAAAGLYTMPPPMFHTLAHTLATGQTLPLDQAINLLLTAGYERSTQVEGVAQFAVRGGILDLFPPAASEPYRVEFWGDEIDSITAFDLATQRRTTPCEQLWVTPVREALVANPRQLIVTLEQHSKALKGSFGTLAKEHILHDTARLAQGEALTSADRYLPLLYPPCTLFDYCSDSLLFVCEPANTKEIMAVVETQQQEDTKILLEEGILFAGCDTFALSYPQIESYFYKYTTTVLDTFTRTLGEITFSGTQQMEAIQLSPWSGDYKLLLEDIEDDLAEHYRIIVLAGTEKAAQTLFEDLTANHLPVEYRTAIDTVIPGTIVVMPGSLSAGMKYPKLGLTVITCGKTASANTKRKARYKSGKKLRHISDLKVGDAVVHVSHGIGIFEGIVKRTIQQITKDYIQIRYAGTDMLFVPVTQLDLVSKYIGGGEYGNIRLSRLNSIEWQKTKSRVKAEVKEMARELAALYAKRRNSQGYAFSPDTDWQRSFEGHFPYEETDDQLRAVREIKADMERSSPMDRLLCGDVGFGKTEVALRAIFKCVMDSKQCVVLVPTTILAWQHYQTFAARFADFPIRLEMLSRFRTPKQQKQILANLKAGNVDVVVGTHRVVQKDVEFKDLGLCIIDEEQRFGVAHKERFKELRANVDVLTLSATPIPRTLNMAMSGLRDMSLIEEPPMDRHPVQTYVLEHEDSMVLQAIHKELRRNGQVFYLHNNTTTIHRVAYKLQEALPEARIEVAHGKMGEETLSNIWRALLEGEIDILVCTTIIETGVDVANANTLIIEDADNYGLAQLYQIRGRVGRSNRRAYAYLTFRRGKALSEIATKRLAAIREFTTFGSGFQIAMRDLEIRGAGNILGARQHGHMEAVGYDMYLQLLDEAVREEHGESSPQVTECTIDIQLDAYIPEQYIANTTQRIDTYRRISIIDSIEDSLDVTDELIDRFGEPPQAVQGLIEVALVRGSAAKAGITDIQQREHNILFYPKHFNMEQIHYLVAALNKRMLVNAGERPYYSVRIKAGQTPLDTIREVLNLLAEEGVQHSPD